MTRTINPTQLPKFRSLQNMKPYKRYSYLLYALCLGHYPVFSQNLLVNYDLEDRITATTYDTSVRADALQLSTGTILFQNGSDGGGLRIGYSTSWNTGAFSSNGKFLQWVIRATGGRQLNPSAIRLRLGRTSTGPTQFTLQTSTDSFISQSTTQIAGAPINSTNVNLLDTFNFSQNLPQGGISTLYVRLWAYQAGSTGNLRFNNLQVLGSLSGGGGTGGGGTGGGGTGGGGTGGGGVTPQPNARLTGIRTRINQHQFQPTNELQSDSLFLWVINDGPQSQSIRARTYAPPLNQAFHTPDSQFTLASGDSMRMRVVFRPTHNIIHNATLLLQPNGGSGPVSVALTGQGRYSLSYYDPTQNLEGVALVTALQQRLVSPYTNLGYSGTGNARLQMFGIIDNWKVNGREPGHSNPYKNECIYTGRTISYTAAAFNTTTLNNAPYEMNTEHTWPQSFGASVEPMLSDLHHIFISDAGTNTARGNKPLDWVATPTQTYPGGSKANSTTFEPRNEHKAAAAAAMLYFRLRYATTAGVDFSYLTPAMEQTYRQWLSNYPPGMTLRQRNSDIALVQQNRNPFIDYPAFLDRIGGTLSSPATPFTQGFYVPDTVRAGQISPGERRILRVPVVNLGTATLTLSNIQVTGGALYTGPATQSVPPGGCATLSLELQWGTEGARTGLVTAQTGLTGSFSLLQCPWSAQVIQNRFQGQGMWNNPQLWSLGYVPGWTDNPLIASGEARVGGWWPQAGLNIAAGATLRLDSTATALPGQLHNEGWVLMDEGARFIPADSVLLTGNGQFRIFRNGHTQPGMLNLWSSPVVGADLQQSFPTARPSGIRDYNGGSAGYPGWNPIPATGAMGSGVGYAVEAGGQATFTGMPHQGSVSVPIGSPQGYYLLGNPYPAPISADSFLFLNSAAGSGVVGGTIYLWNQQLSALQSHLSGTDYAVWAGGTGVAGSGSNGGAGAAIPDGTLGIGQAFFVAGGPQTGHAWFRPSMRLQTGGGGALLRTSSAGGASSPPSVAISPSIGRLWLGVRSADPSQGIRHFSQMAVVLRDDAGSSFDPLYDAPRWASNAPLSLWSHGGGQSLSIQALEWPAVGAGHSIPLGVEMGSPGPVDFCIDSLSNLSGLPAGSSFGVWLEDRLLGQWYDLHQGPVRCVILIPTSLQRFFLHLGSPSRPSGVPDIPSLSNPRLTFDGGTYRVIGLLPGAELEFFDLRGALVHRFTPPSDSECTLDRGVLRQGPLLLRIRQQGRTHSIPLFVGE